MSQGGSAPTTTGSKTLNPTTGSLDTHLHKPDVIAVHDLLLEIAVSQCDNISALVEGLSLCTTSTCSSSSSRSRNIMSISHGENISDLQNPSPQPAERLAARSGYCVRAEVPSQRECPHAATPPPPPLPQLPLPPACPPLLQLAPPPLQCCAAFVAEVKGSTD